MTVPNHPKIRLTAFVIALCMALSGCKEVLYSGLSEVEANEMLAILESHGLAASRSSDKDGVYALSVEAADLAKSIVVLRQEGYPKAKFESLGEVFSAQGIVGTPFEQHARYIHAMNQELSATLSSISGVASAQVLITAPEAQRYERETPSASASVTINYVDGFLTNDNVAKIKMIVSHSLPNLAYDDVAVAFFPASGPMLKPPPPAPNAVNAAAVFQPTGFSFSQFSANAQSRVLIFVLVLAVMAAVALIIVRFYPSVLRRRS